MRTSFVVAIFLLLFVATVNLQAQTVMAPEGSSTSFVTGYKEDGFHGENVKFLVGEYSTIDKDWKDKLRSIALSGGIRVSLFDKEKFEGKKLVVEQNMYDLGDFNGKTASMIVEAFSCGHAIAYKDTIYRGDSKQFTAGKYEKLTDGWNGMKSMDLCGSVTVTLFNKENFQGESMAVKSDRIDLGKFNKNVKSMTVEAAPAQ